MLLRSTCRSKVHSDRNPNVRVCGLGRSRASVLGKSFGRAKAISGDRSPLIWRLQKGHVHPIKGRSQSFYGCWGFDDRILDSDDC
jgi:hypothetical protein